jgi:hypothetical protein
MTKKIILFLFCNFCLVTLTFCQKPPRQTEIDTSFTDYDALFNELDSFLDSLTEPRSFLVANVGISTGYYNYASKESYVAEPVKKVLISPSISYFSKTGLGIGGAVSIINDGQKINPYQFSITGSYDYLKNKKFLSGIALTRFITKSNVPFYTSPLQNGAFAYFTYRDLIIKPTISANYGWGSRSAYTERKELINSIRLKKRGYTRVNTLESINDLTVTASIKHDFYWLNVFSKNEYIRLTPQVSFVSGTQKFGINQSSDTYGIVKGTGANILFNSQNSYLDDSRYFQPLSLSGFIKTEYAKGKFFVQPQIMVDYYFPAKENNLGTALLLNTGFIF